MSRPHWLLLAPALLLAAACSKPAAPAASTAAAPAAAEVTPQKIAQATVQQFEIHPQTIKKEQPVTVNVRLQGIPDGTPLTLSWFGPDSWLVNEDTKDAHGDAIGFSAPAAVFKDAGRYRAELRSGYVYLGDGALEVTE